MADTMLSPDNHFSESEILRRMEDEHLRLQRQVRVIQQNRNDEKSGVHPQFRRSDALLKVLKDEYISLKKDLKIARSGRHKQNEREMKREMKRSVLLMMKTQKEADDGVTLMEQIEDLLSRKSKAMLELKKAVTTSVGELNRRRYQSELRLLSTENRLETTQKRFNSVQSENLKIREEIDNMLKDRNLFNHCWKKMLTVLGKGKKFLTDLFESSTLAYDQRDEWCGKLKSLQEKGKLDQMTQIQDYTEEESINKIVLDFKKRERENFAIYQLLVEYCAENVTLAKDLEKTRQELDDRRDWNEQSENKREEAIKKLNDQLHDQTQKTDMLRKQSTEQDQFLNKIIKQTDEMFKMLKCSPEPFQNLLGDKSPSLHQSNLTLKLITEKIKEYVETVYFYERHVNKRLTDRDPGTSRLKTYTIHPDLQKTFTAAPITFLVPAETCPACVEARWLSRVSEHDEKPFTKEDALSAINELSEDPSYLRSDRVHCIVDCRAPKSRVLLAGRYAQK
ncbi:meiosis-specific nuclear structural protein 1-like [Hyposmocoma kahamanoa]|uniref:meiosis-specific nuclear structural protein 1-like n=1 Tax=Hyposmocoma kahamanoa TaxID=1477025 RepID=UPI000E6D90F9|nr:meiosis-specific nuclear structural protein 1-like [Hyposmocoma kahamanoa]